MDVQPKDILLKAVDLVSGDRAAQHGNHVECFETTARLWSAYLDAWLKQLDGGTLPAPLRAEDVASLLELLKIGRRLTGALNLDNGVDGAGYAALWAALATE
jgi:hypothetical protein